MKIILVTVLFCAFIEDAFGHGRLIDPPSRSTAWRYGFKTTPNYNDHELYCGGYQVQWGINGGKCGVCGDPYNGERKNELPNGIYTRNLQITRNYQRGGVITAKVQLTANHGGYFQFKLCPAHSMNVEVTQGCLDGNTLQVLNSRDRFKYFLPNRNAQTFDARLKLPDGITCNRCVFQWTYTAGNNWGNCGDGSSRVGCGQQETFRACADVSIGGSGGNGGNRPQPRPDPRPEPRPEPKPEPRPEQPGGGSNCRPSNAHRNTPGMNEWCKANCAAGYCPATHCTC